MTSEDGTRRCRTSRADTVHAGMRTPTMHQALKQIIWEKVQYWSQWKAEIWDVLLFGSIGYGLMDWPISWDNFAMAIDCLQGEGLLHYDQEKGEITRSAATLPFPPVKVSE